MDVQEFVIHLLSSPKCLSAPRVDADPFRGFRVNSDMTQTSDNVASLPEYQVGRIAIFMKHFLSGFFFYLLNWFVVIVVADLALYNQHSTSDSLQVHSNYLYKGRENTDAAPKFK